MFLRTTPPINLRLEQELGAPTLVRYGAESQASVESDKIDTKSVTMETFVNFLHAAPASHRELIFETGGSGNVSRLCYMTSM